MGLQVLSRLMSFAVAEGLIGLNHCTGIPHFYRSDRADLIWTEDDFARLERHASLEVIQAARLAALTALRKSDLLRLSWSHIGPLAIEIPTGKSGRRKTTLIPLYGELRDHVATIPKRSTAVLTNTKGQAWRGGFGASWNDAVKAAGIDLHFHDLGGTAATRFYLAGFSIREIAELMTWSEDRVERLIDRYVKRDEILRDRIRRLDQNRRATDSAKPSAKPSAPEGNRGRTPGGQVEARARTRSGSGGIRGGSGTPRRLPRRLPRSSKKVRPCFWQVFIRPRQASRASRPASLQVPPETLRLVT